MVAISNKNGQTPSGGGDEELIAKAKELLADYKCLGFEKGMSFDDSRCICLYIYIYVCVCVYV